MNVFINATCRNPDLLRATTLVFDTLRVGYPTAHVTVFLNAIEDSTCKREVVSACRLAEVDELVDLSDRTMHHVWIESLVETEHEPFVVLDTDIIFWNKCEHWEFALPLAGRRLPEFDDAFTKCITRPRLEASHLWFRPAEVRHLIEKYRAQFPSTPLAPGANLFYPVYLPFTVDGRPLTFFHDTCCLLYQAIGGDAFTEAQLDCYDHLKCGTIADLVDPHLPRVPLREAHDAVFENPELARGAWRNQDKYYLSRRPTITLSQHEVA